MCAVSRLVVVENTIIRGGVVLFRMCAVSRLVVVENTIIRGGVVARMCAVSRLVLGGRLMALNLKRDLISM
jgi:NDP-sugar pyrophosphorylase family protein